MLELSNTTVTVLALDTTTTRPYYYNLTPLMVLVAVCGVILFCCVCLTSYNSFMKHKHKQLQQEAISYGEQEQQTKKFGSIFMTYMPKWMTERINAARAPSGHDEERSDSSDITQEKELLLSLSRVHYFSCKENNIPIGDHDDSHSTGGSESEVMNTKLHPVDGEREH